MTETFDQILKRASTQTANKAERAKQKEKEVVDWVAAHNGKLPSSKSKDEVERQLGRFLQYRRRKKIQQ